MIVGLPSGTFVAGRYVARTLGAEPVVGAAVAVAILLTGLAVNFAGLRTSSRVQTLATWALMLVVSLLLASAIPAARGGLGAVAPSTDHLGVVFPALVLAFWAFTGFENLTFLVREFRHPEHDFLPVSFAALSAYGLLTILLTVAIAVTIRRADVDQVVGLLQLAASLGYGRILIWSVTFIACSATLLNSVAWVWGVSHLVRDAATDGTIPRAFAIVDAHEVPRRALLLLVVLFSFTCITLALRPDWVIDATAAASAIFMLLYVLTIVSYVRVRGVSARSVLNVALLVVIAISLAQSRWVVLYGVSVLVAALGVSWFRGGRRAGQPEPLGDAMRRSATRRHF